MEELCVDQTFHFALDPNLLDVLSKTLFFKVSLIMEIEKERL